MLTRRQGRRNKHFENNELQTLLEKMQKDQNFIIDDTKTVFYGNCKRCLDEKQNA